MLPSLPLCVAVSLVDFYCKDTFGFVRRKVNISFKIHIFLNVTVVEMCLKCSGGLFCSTLTELISSWVMTVISSTAKLIKCCHKYCQS